MSKSLSSRSETPRRRPILAPWVVLLTTATLSMLAAGGVTAWIDSRERLEEEHQVTMTEARIARRLEVCAAQLRAGAGLFAAIEERVTRDQFERFAERAMLYGSQGIHGLGWATVLATPAEGAAAIAEAHAAGITTFRLFPGDWYPRTAILYLEPRDRRNLVALGYDMYSEPTRRSAMARARDTGTAAMSGRVVLVQEIEGPVQPGFLVYVPLYRGGIPETVEQRRAQFEGWVYAPVRAGELVASVIADVDYSVDVEVFDGDRPSEEARLFGQPTADLSRARVVQRDLLGRTWTLRITPRSPGVPTSYGAGLVAAILALVLTFMSFRAARIEALARARAEDALARESREAQFRETFLGVLGHDLRNPLGATLMTAQTLLRRSGLDSTQRRALERIVSSASRASRMVSQLLDFTTLRVGGGLAIQKARIDLVSVVHDVVGELRAAHEGRTIEVQVPSTLYIEGDADRLAQVIANLGANALGHGDPDRPIRISAGNRGGELVVSVWNAGRPVPQEVIPMLFDPFEQ